MSSLLKTLRWPIGVALVAGVALVVAGAGGSRPGLIAYTFCAFVLTTIVVELVRGTRATGSLLRLVAGNRRRYGGYVVHASIVLLAIGVAGSSAYSSSVERKLQPGQSMTVAGYTLTYRGVETTKGPTAFETRALLSLSGKASGTLRTGANDYFVGGNSREVGIHTNWLRAEDLYTILDQKNGNAIYLKVLVKPLVNFVWIAGIVFVLGSLVALWPDAREQRRLAARLALARA